MQRRIADWDTVTERKKNPYDYTVYPSLVKRSENDRATEDPTVFLNQAFKEEQQRLAEEGETSPTAQRSLYRSMNPFSPPQHRTGKGLGRTANGRESVLGGDTSTSNNRHSPTKDKNEASPHRTPSKTPSPSKPRPGKAKKPSSDVKPEELSDISTTSTETLSSIVVSDLSDESADEGEKEALLRAKRTAAELHQKHVHEARHKKREQLRKKRREEAEAKELEREQRKKAEEHKTRTSELQKSKFKEELLGALLTVDQGDDAFSIILSVFPFMLSLTKTNCSFFLIPSFSHSLLGTNPIYS